MCCGDGCCPGLCCDGVCYPELDPQEYACCEGEVCTWESCCRGVGGVGCCPGGAPCCDWTCCEVGQSCCDDLYGDGLICVDEPSECCGEPDCNRNNVKDECDIAGQTSTDKNASGVPDECEFSNVFIGTGGGGAPGTNTGLGRVYRYLGGTEWEDLTPDGLGDASVVMDLVVYEGHLYAATQTLHGAFPGVQSQGQVWRHDGATAWTLIENLGDANWHVDTVTDLEVLDGKLHAVAIVTDISYPGAPMLGGAVYRCMACDGADWQRIPQAAPPYSGNSGFRTAFVTTLCGTEQLFIGEADWDGFWRLEAGANSVVEQVDEQQGSCVWDITEYDDALYASALNGLVYRMGIDGCGEPDFGPLAVTNISLLNWALAEYKDKLYVGAASTVGGSSTGARLLSYDARTGVWDSKVKTWPTTFAGEGVSCLGNLFDSDLYIGLGMHEAWSCLGDGNATVWRYNGTTFQSISPPDAFWGGVQCILVTHLAGSDCGDGIAEGAERCDGNDLREASCDSLGFAYGTLGCSPSCQYDATECVSPPDGCGDGIVNNAECCDGADMGTAQTCEALSFTGGSLTCSPLCTYDVSACTPQMPSPGTAVLIVGGDRALLPLAVQGNCPASAYEIEYDTNQLTFWDAPSGGTQMLNSTLYYNLECSTRFYAQAESASAALNDIHVELWVDPSGQGAALEEVDSMSLTAVAIDVSPSTGPIGAPLTVTLAPAIPPLAFDCSTHAEWRGHFHPIVGTPGDEIAIVYSPDRFFESSPSTATIFVGDGRLATGVSPNSLLVQSSGSLVGTATVYVHGIGLRRTLSLLADPPSIRARELISDPNDLSLPRQYGEVMTEVGICRVVEPMDPDALTGNLGHHFAIELCVPDAAQPPSSWPSNLTVSIATVDATGVVLDSVPGVTLYEAPDADWQGCHVYHTPVDAPLIAVDSPVDKGLYPSLTILVAGTESDIVILPGGPQ